LFAVLFVVFAELTVANVILTTQLANEALAPVELLVVDSIDGNLGVRWHILGSTDKMDVSDESRRGVSQTRMGNEARVREDGAAAGCDDIVSRLIVLRRTPQYDSRVTDL